MQVENTAYNLHRSFLEMKSPVWKDMFTMPLAKGSSEGVTLDNPIVLPQITTAEFDELLSFLYHQYVLPRIASWLDLIVTDGHLLQTGQSVLLLYCDWAICTKLMMPKSSRSLPWRHTPPSILPCDSSSHGSIHLMTGLVRPLQSSWSFL